MSSRASQRFMQWNIPSRLSERGEHRPREPEVLGRASTMHMLPECVGEVADSCGAIKHYSGQLGGKIPGAHLSPIPPATGRATSRISRPMSKLLPPVTPGCMPPPSRCARSPLKVRMTPNKQFDLRHENTLADFRPKSFQQSFRPEAVSQAEKWMQTASDSERRVISNALRLQKKQDDMRHGVLEETLLSEARHEVEQWMQTASERERAVAVKFFSTVAKSQSLGDTSCAQQDRLQQVIQALESRKPQAAYPDNKLRQSDTFEHPGNKLKYLRLLSPESREQPFVHRSWHHLPSPGKPAPAYNPTSVYTQPHRQIPRHFRIHPEWG